MCGVNMSKLKKIFCIFSVTAIVICCCCFSASAATIKGLDNNFIKPDSCVVYMNYPDGSGQVISEYGPIINATAGGIGTTFFETPSFVNQTDDYYVNTFVFDFNLKNPIYTGEKDILKFVSNFELHSDLSTTYVYLRMFQIRYSGPTDNGGRYHSILYSSDVINLFSGSHAIDVTREAVSNVKIDKLQLYMQFIVNVKGNYQRGMRFGFTRNDLTFRYGTQQDIAGDIAHDETNERLDNILTEQYETNELLGDITADKYNPPDGSNFENIEDVEGELLEGSEEGLNSAQDLFDNFTLGIFADGIRYVSTLFENILSRISWLGDLLFFSLALGIFSFLLNIASVFRSVFSKKGGD